MYPYRKIAHSRLFYPEIKNICAWEALKLFVPLSYLSGNAGTVGNYVKSR